MRMGAWHAQRRALGMKIWDAIQMSLRNCPTFVEKQRTS